MKLTPVNLYSAPFDKNDEELYQSCSHGPWMMLYSEKIMMCYRCGHRQPIDYNYYPVHQR